MIKKFGRYFLLFLAITIVYFGYQTYQKLVLISGFYAKNTASAIFLADRTLESVANSDNNFAPVNWANSSVDYENKSVLADVWGLQQRKAYYREGLGAILAVGDNDGSQLKIRPKREQINDTLPYPYGSLEQEENIFDNVDYSKLSDVVTNYMNQNEPTNTTKAFLIIYKNQIIAEEYAEGYNRDTRFLGWSMTKSIMSSVFGVMEAQGRIHHNNPTGIVEWQNDDRSKITNADLLEMNSGLEWEENYSKICDATIMLYNQEDMTVLPRSKSLTYQPQTHWYYSSGTSNILAGIIRDQFTTHQEYLDYWYTDFIDRIGMNSMVVETDLAGNYAASSYAWATARDWARFGLLYLNEGNWNGDQVLTKEWIDYVRTPTPTSEGIYGGQFWMNAGGHLPDVPKDMYMAMGYQGQRVYIIPSKELVIVRLGVSYGKLKELRENHTLKIGSENPEIEKFEYKNIGPNKMLKSVFECFILGV